MAVAALEPLVEVCSCSACEAGLEPFTVEHFRVWALDLTLDNGEPWKVEEFFLLYLEDYFADVSECWLVVPEGNTKTTSQAGLAVYLLEHRRRAGIPWAASSRDQAEIGYRQAEGFVLSSPRLKKFLKCQEGYRRIKNLRDGGRLQVFAADDKTGDGIIPTDAFLDELHRHKNMRLYRTWVGKLLKRGAQIGAISTAGEPGEEFEQVRERIRQETPIVELRDGFTHCRSDRIALHDWAVAEDGDIEDFEVVKAANPFSGITVQMLKEKFESPTMTHTHWRRFVCNLPTRSESAAIQEKEWFDAATKEEIPAGEPIWLGLDVAWKWDTTAAVPLWVRDSEFRLLGPASVLVPPRDGSSLDPHVVERTLIEINKRNPVHTVVMDTNKAEQLAVWIEEELGATVVDRQQTNSLATMDYSRFMEALRMGWLRHSGDPDMTKHALNAVARILPQGDARFDRPHQSRLGEQESRVIDALTAASMVHSLAASVIEEPEEPLVAWA